MIHAALVQALLLMVLISGTPTLHSQNPPDVQLDPENLHFGKQVVKKPSAAKTLTVTNVGGDSLYINSATISGDNWKDFTLLKDTCSGKKVAAQGSCLITVRFTPNKIEERNATLVLTDNASDSPQNVPLKGVGINSIDVAPF
jgi:HYDIN/CFA65/VesB-like, Ig-like domain